MCQIWSRSDHRRRRRYAWKDTHTLSYIDIDCACRSTYWHCARHCAMCDRSLPRWLPNAHQMRGSLRSYCACCYWQCYWRCYIHPVFPIACSIRAACQNVLPYIYAAAEMEMSLRIRKTLFEKSYFTLKAIDTGCSEPLDCREFLCVHLFIRSQCNVWWILQWLYAYTNFQLVVTVQYQHSMSHAMKVIHFRVSTVLCASSIERLPVDIILTRIAINLQVICLFL